MIDEQERAEFEAWALHRWSGVILSPYQNDMGNTISERFKHPTLQAAWEAWQAGRAALQSQDREDIKEAIESLPRYDNRRFLRVDEVMVAIDHARRRIEGENK